MAKNFTTIIDIGSSSVVTMIGERGINHSFRVLGKGEVNYDGFSNGKFFDPDSLKNVIAMSISNAEQSSGLKVTDVFLGVPGEFCNCLCKDVTIDLSRKRKVKQSDIYALFEHGIKPHPTYSTINHSAIYYTLDDGKRVIDPVGKTTKMLTGKICYILAENNFLDFISNIFAEIGIKHLLFLSSNLAEMTYLLDPAIRDRYAILADVGYITTNVMVGQGDGLLFLNSFSMGGGHITGDLCQVLNIPFAQAETLKHKVVLNWQATENDTYEIMGKEFISTHSARATNEITEARIEIIANYILKCLARCDYEIPDYLPIYVTGGGVSYIKGVRDFLSSKLGRKVQILTPGLAHSERPDLSSEISLLNLAIEQTENDYNLIYSSRW